MATCTCGHDEWMHYPIIPTGRGWCSVPGCDCTHPTPAPAGVSAAPTSRDSHAEDPAGAPLYSEDRCDNGHVLDCCGGCKCEGTTK